MSFDKSDLRIVNIEFETDSPVESRNNSRNSMNDELLSHYSYTDSDLHDFKKLEKDIYGSHGDDESSQDHDIMQEFLEDVTDEQTESLDFVRPHVPVRPSLGNPIDTYDQLQTHYEPLKHSTNNNRSILNQNYKKNKSNEKLNQTVMSPTFKSRGSSQASGGSAETVLSQSQQLDEVPSIKTIPDKLPKSRNMVSSVSSTESTARTSKKRIANRATLRTLLDQEKATRKSQETYIEHLQQSLHQLLSQHALAKETIDQLRLGIALNIEETNNRSKLRRHHHQKQPSATSNSQILSRRFSSIVDGADIVDYMEKGNNISRAKSVDMNIFDEESSPEIIGPHQANDEYGGSLKYVKKEQSSINQGLSKEIANDFQLNFDKFQTRVEIIEQAIEELNMYIDGGASGSSGSQYGDLDGSNDRHQTDTENRLQNILLAYENLQKDFNQVCRVWKDTAKNYIPATKAMHSMDSTEQIEGNLFQLRMQLDDLERHVKQSRHQQQQSSSIPHETVSKNGLGRNENLIKRLATLEENYRKLMERYDDLKRLPSPSNQKDVENIVQQLQNIVLEANGRSKEIATPENFENMLHQDLIDSMKRNLTNSPSYFHMEEDGLSSANSSFGKGRSRFKIGQKLYNDNNEQNSPVKSHSSPFSMDIKRSPSSQIPKYNSQPGSIVSSTSGFQGATSGETLLIDDNGIFQEQLRQNSRSTNDVFMRSSKPDSKPITKSYSFNNKVNVESFKNRPKSSVMQDLDDDVKRLDEHLAKIELVEKAKQEENANQNSDAAGSRNTRSLLGTSPSDSNYSRPSKVDHSAGGSSDKSHKKKYLKQGYNHKEIRRAPNAHRRFFESTDSEEEESDSVDENLENYVRKASCGLGQRSRFIRKNNKNVQDRWSQTPIRPRRKSSRPRTFCHDMSPPFEDPYVDDVAYWNGVAFHPVREGLPGKSILRQSSPHSKRSRKHLHKTTTPFSVDNYSDLYVRPSFPIQSRNNFTEPNQVREYSTLGPQRYFVREYGQLNRYPTSHFPMYRGYEEDEEEEEYPYRKYVEERRLCNYLDEAIKAARDMKHYTRRLSDISQQRTYGRTHDPYYNRSFRSLYT